MEKILIISTGGTFNKVYNPKEGTLEVQSSKTALETLSKHWLCELHSLDIVGKDSLDMTQADREEIAQTIAKHPQEKIIVIHGTDTMHLTASYLDEANLNKQIVLTGAMVPFSIDPIEATANLSCAYGFLLANPPQALYIAMNGHCLPHMQIKKAYQAGKFKMTHF